MLSEKELKQAPEKKKRQLPVVIDPLHIQLFKNCSERHAQRLHKQIRSDLNKDSKYAVLTLNEVCDVFCVSKEEFIATIRYNMLPENEKF